MADDLTIIDQVSRGISSFENALRLLGGNIDELARQRNLLLAQLMEKPYRTASDRARIKKLEELHGAIRVYLDANSHKVARHFIGQEQQMAVLLTRLAQMREAMTEMWLLLQTHPDAQVRARLEYWRSLIVVGDENNG